MEIIFKYFTDLTVQQTEQFGMLEGLYKEWNEKINVISRKDIDNLYEKHVLHSLSIAVTFDFKEGTKIIDIGTGGGFPGIPLAIFFPEASFHLVDSVAKKIKVVDAIAGSLKLKNVTTQHARAEEIRNISYEFVVSRAVAPLNDLWKWSKPLLKKAQGTRHKNPTSRIRYPGLICLKGGDLTKEIKESNTKPLLIEISDIFPESYFSEKYILYVPRDR